MWFDTMAVCGYRRAWLYYFWSMFLVVLLRASSKHLGPSTSTWCVSTLDRYCWVWNIYTRTEPFTGAINRESPLWRTSILNVCCFRDMKPGNLLVDTIGNLKISDFGCSKWTGSPQTAQPMSIVGTPNYMAPEVCPSIFVLGLTWESGRFCGVRLDSMMRAPTSGRWE